MQNITSIDELHEAIVALESRRREQEQELTNRFRLLHDALRPVNLIKNIVRDLVGSTDVQHGVLNAAMGIVSGYLSRKLFVRSRTGLVTKILGAALQFGITALVAKKGNTVRAGGTQLLRSLMVNHNGNGSR